MIKAKIIKKFITKNGFFDRVLLMHLAKKSYYSLIKLGVKELLRSKRLTEGEKLWITLSKIKNSH